MMQDSGLSSTDSLCAVISIPTSDSHDRKEEPLGLGSAMLALPFLGNDGRSLQPQGAAPHKNATAWVSHVLLFNSSLILGYGKKSDWLFMALTESFL